MFSSNLPLDLDQKLQKQQGQEIRIMYLTPLKFLYHLLENSRIFQRSSGFEHAHVIGDSVMPENIFYIASGKVDPVYFRQIFSVIYIPLRFLRAVENHMSGSYNGVLLAFVKIKMGFSGRNIKDLEIQPSFRPVRGQPGTGIQMISAAASDDKRTAFVFEVYKGAVQVGGINIHAAAPFRICRG